MIWKKQPVGSKLADLQNNKASKDAATQNAAGLMSAADKTKLDGIALNYKNLGSFATEADLIAALNTEIASMGNNTQRAINFNMSAVTDSFLANYYHGTLSRGSGVDYCSMLVTTYSNRSIPHDVIGCKNGTWGFNNLNSKTIHKANVKVIESPSITLTAGERKNVTIPFGETITNIITAFVIKTPNAALVCGSVGGWNSVEVVCGFGNLASSDATGTAMIGIVYDG